MFNPYQTLQDAFIENCLERYREAFPNRHLGHEELLEQAAQTALETLLRCDCPYHDVTHTIMATDAGQAILRGRLIAQGDIAPQQWVQVVIALLFHDIGYLRGLLREDAEHSYVADEAGNRVTPPAGATDAFLMPYHVTRGCLYVQERFAHEPLVDIPTVVSHIEMTRFPVPEHGRYQPVDTLGGLVRAADLIGQIGDPLYNQKLARLFVELNETGEAQRLGYANVSDLRAGFPAFFQSHVRPYVSEGLRFLGKTQEGQRWLANLAQQLHGEFDDAEAYAPSRPHIAISNG